MCFTLWGFTEERYETRGRSAPVQPVIHREQSTGLRKYHCLLIENLAKASIWLVQQSNGFFDAEPSISLSGDLKDNSRSSLIWILDISCKEQSGFPNSLRTIPQRFRRCSRLAFRANGGRNLRVEIEQFFCFLICESNQPTRLQQHIDLT